MTKRYMDFVPSGAARPVETAKASASVKVSKSTASRTTTSKSVTAAKTSKPVAKTTRATMTARPATRDKAVVSSREAKSLEEFTWKEAGDKKAFDEEPKFGVIEDLHPKEEKQVSERKAPYSPTKKNPFVNTEKVKKRPLSKNVYQKKVVVPKEEPSKTVTIITKPEKDSKVGVIVAIILTIILGAAAGTVAFLLLPK